MLKITDKDREYIKKTLDQFKHAKGEIHIFYDLCFCICSPQTTYESNCGVNRTLWEKLFHVTDIPLKELEQIIKPTRFIRKAGYLLEAKENFHTILQHTYYKADWDGFAKRKWLVDNVKGLGMKTASMFLRNMGEEDLSILDVHTLRFLGVTRIKNPNHYIMLEQEFRKRAQDHNLSVAGLDVYIWKVGADVPWEEFVI